MSSQKGPIFSRITIPPPRRIKSKIPPRASPRGPPTDVGNFRSNNIHRQIRLAEAIQRTNLASSSDQRHPDADSLEAELIQLAFDILVDVGPNHTLGSLHSDLVEVFRAFIWSKEKKLSVNSAKRYMTYRELSHQYGDERKYVYDKLVEEKGTKSSQSKVLQELSDANFDLQRQLQATFDLQFEQKQEKLALENKVQELNNLLRESKQTELNLQMAIQQANTRLQSKNTAQEELGKKLLTAQMKLREVEKVDIHSELEEYHRKYLQKEKECLATEKSWAKATAMQQAMRQKALIQAEQISSLEKKIKDLHKKCTDLKFVRDDLLAPFTPRPKFRELYASANEMDITATLLDEADRSTSDQVSELLKYLERKDSELVACRNMLEQSLEVQNKTKRTLDRTEREMDKAIGFDPDAKTADTQIVSWQKPKATSKYFVALGNRAQVPVFLRTSGKIRNRHLKKKECESTVRDVWAKKMLHDRSMNMLDMNLRDFFYVYLKNKFGLKNIIVEWGYNMMDGLDRYRFDADCELFYKILTGDVPEEVYYDQLQLLEELTNLFVRLELLRQTRKSGTLPLLFLRKCLRLFFPFKEHKPFEQIVHALEDTIEEDPRCATDYTRIFAENREMNEAPFIEEVRDQHLYEIENFMIDLRSAVTGIRKKVDSKVRIHEIQVAWSNLDPHSSIDVINASIGRALRVPSSQRVEMNLLVDPNNFADGLFSSQLVKRANSYNAQARFELPVNLLPASDAIDKKLDLKKLLLEKPQLGGDSKDSKNLRGNISVRRQKQRLHALSLASIQQAFGASRAATSHLDLPRSKRFGSILIARSDSKRTGGDVTKTPRSKTFRMSPQPSFKEKKEGNRSTSFSNGVTQLPRWKQRSSDTKSETVVIVSINDISELDNLCQLQALMEEIRNVGHNAVYLTLSGNFLSSSTLSVLDQGQTAVNMLNEIGVDFVCLGCHDFDLPLDILKLRLARLKSRVICSNINGLKLGRKYTTTTLQSGFKIGWLGLSDQSITSSMHPMYYQTTDINILSVTSRAHEMASDLMNGSDTNFNITLTSDKIETCLQLLEHNSEIDMVLAGSNKQEHISKDISTSNRFCTNMLPNAKNAAVFTLTISPQSGESKSSSSPKSDARNSTSISDRWIVQTNLDIVKLDAFHPSDRCLQILNQGKALMNKFTSQSICLLPWTRKEGVLDKEGNESENDERILEELTAYQQAVTAASSMTVRDINLLKRWGAKASNLFKRICDAVALILQLPLCHVTNMMTMMIDNKSSSPQRRMFIKDSFERTRDFFCAPGVPDRLLEQLQVTSRDTSRIQVSDNVLLNPETLELLEPYLSCPDFTVENTESIAKIAALLCQWVLASVNYYHLQSRRLSEAKLQSKASRVTDSGPSRYQRIMDTLITAATSLSSRNASMVQTSIGSLFCDLAKIHFDSDFCVLSSDCLQGNRIYPQGKLCPIHVKSELPAHNGMVVIPMTGDELEACIQFANQTPGQPFFLQLDSELVYNETINQVFRKIDAKDNLAGENANVERVDAKKTYKVAMTLRQALGADGNTATIQRQGCHRLSSIREEDLPSLGKIILKHSIWVRWKFIQSHFLKLSVTSTNYATLGGIRVRDFREYLVDQLGMKSELVELFFQTLHSDILTLQSVQNSASIGEFAATAPKDATDLELDDLFVLRSTHLSSFLGKDCTF